MSTSTSIQWTDVTDNIFRVKGGGWWCRMISEGCVNCYAAKLNQSSFFGGNKLAYTGEAPAMELQMDILWGWQEMTKPKKHFVASMTDIFGDWLTYENDIEPFLNAMKLSPKQTFQMLTKRPDIAHAHIKQWLDQNKLNALPDNMWIGTSVENQKRADERIPHLICIPAKVRFLSVEPMLEAINLEMACEEFQPLNPDMSRKPAPVQWIIFGGESGPSARPCSVEWIRDGVNQCKTAKIPAFVKQLGQRPDQTNSTLDTTILFPCEDGHPHYYYWPKLKDKKGGDMAEWPTDLHVRQMPTP